MHTHIQDDARRPLLSSILKKLKYYISIYLTPLFSTCELAAADGYEDTVIVHTYVNIHVETCFTDPLWSIGRLDLDRLEME